MKKRVLVSSLLGGALAFAVAVTPVFAQSAIPSTELPTDPKSSTTEVDVYATPSTADAYQVFTSVSFENALAWYGLPTADIAAMMNVSENDYYLATAAMFNVSATDPAKVNGMYVTGLNRVVKNHPVTVMAEDTAGNCELLTATVNGDGTITILSTPTIDLADATFVVFIGTAKNASTKTSTGSTGTTATTTTSTSTKTGYNVPNTADRG